jgi:hypothetical protein
MQPETQKNMNTHTHRIRGERRGRKGRKEQGKNGGGVTCKGEMAGESRGLANRPSTELQSPARLESCKEGREGGKAGD